MSDKAIIFTVIGIVVGLLVSGERLISGAIFGALSGYLLATVYQLQQKVQRLAKQLEQGATTAEESTAQAVVSKLAPVVEVAKSASHQPEPELKSARAAESRFTLQPASNAQPSSTSDEQKSNRLMDYIRRFFSDGNVMVKVGLLILFVGVGFLLKFAAEHSLFPIELRLGGVFLLSIALLVIGWRLRQRRRGYALLLQGGAVGIMYLTIFAAAKLYQLFPLPLALVVLIVLVMASSLLAIIQDSKALAMFAAAGGFLAPVLTSTGNGNHVMLFSYYLLLNSGILFIAWHKAWRELNLEAYLFTFIIGALWGSSAYGPEHYATTEPFLLAFFAMFVAISVLFAWRRAPTLKDYVDGTLVFGVPMSAFALQALMLRDTEYGLALSALGFGAVYVVLATILWRLHRETLRLLTESFLAIGVALLTLAIPFAVDGQISAAAWALEGAGLVWVGVRQSRRLSLASGVALQFLAGVLFFQEPLNVAADALPFMHVAYIGALLIAISSLFAARYLEAHGKERSLADIRIDLLLFLWGGLWWYGSAVHEIIHFHGLGPMSELISLVLLLTLSALLQHGIDRRYPWPLAVETLSLHIPALALLSLLIPLLQQGNVLAHMGYLVLPLAAVVHYYLLRRHEAAMTGGQLALQHIVITWWLLYLLCWEAYWLLTTQAALNETWGYLAWGLIPALLALSILQLVKRITWPFVTHAGLYSSKVISPLFLFTWLWVIFASGKVGDPAPLPYIPILNPLELASLLLMLVGGNWLLGLHRQGGGALIFFKPKQLAVVLAITAFVWLNTVIAHSVHYYAGVAYQPEAIFNAVAFQMAIAICWTLLALGLTYLAHRLASRRLWIIGATLLAVVVVKLVFIDLANSGTIERIISFISVGLLMLLIGYVAPLPPQQQKDKTV